MGCACKCDLGISVPTLHRFPSPPYFRSLLPSATSIAEIEEGDSREPVDDLFIVHSYEP